MPETPPHPKTPGSSRLKHLAKNLGLSALSAGVFFICLEMTLRIAALAPTDTLAYPDAATWSRSPGPFEPGQEFVDRFRRRLPHRIRVNALGFRGEEFNQAKPPGVQRVLCVGDSYTFGDYVDDDETFPAALQKKLRKETGRSVEVINAGVNGYTITDEAGFLEEKGFDLQPDVVVVGVVLNDLADLTRRVSSRENQRAEARAMSESPLTPLKRLLRRTATYNLLFVLKASIIGGLKLDPTVQEMPIRHLLHPPYDERTEELFAKYGAALEGLAESCRRRGVRLTLVLFPFYEQVVDGASAEAQARLARLAAEAGVQVIDLLPAFRRAGPRAPRLFLMPLDHHPSSRGYRMAAAEVAKVLAADLSAAGGTAPPG